MSIPITRPKIIVPQRRSELLSRARLLSQLDELVDRRLVILSAPPGYGKTSLLIDFAQRSEYAVCWYTLDALDRETVQFIAHLLAALAHRFPRFGQSSVAALQDSAKLDLNRLVTGIVNEVYETIPEHFILVFDDYQWVDSSPEISYFVNELIRKASDNFHFIISTRTLVSLPDLTLWVAQAAVGGLGMRDLAFRADEIEALVLQNYHERLPESAVHELERETEGWITALVLSAQLGKRASEEWRRLGLVTGVGLYDYMASQVLDQQTPTTRDFLLRTCLFEEFNADLLQAVFESPTDEQGISWEQNIHNVLRKNLFALPVDDSGVWVRYHHLFREFLQARFGRERPLERARILRRLGAVYVEQQEWDKAHLAYHRLGDVSALADLIERAGSSLIKNGRFTLLKKWLDDLPQEWLSARPALASLRGEVELVMVDTQQGIEWLDRAVNAFRSAPETNGLARALLRRATGFRLVGNYQGAIADANETLEMSEGDESLVEIRAEALRVKGLSLHRVGQLHEALALLESSDDLYAAIGLPQNVAMVQSELGMVCRALGLYDRARSSYHRALNYWRQINSLSHQANALNSLGVLYHFEEEYDQALSSLDQALDCARQSGYTLVEAFTLASRGDVYVDLDMLGAAFEAYQQARQVAQTIHNQFLLLYVNVAEAALARRAGESERARQLLAAAQNTANTTKSNYEKALYLLESGRFAFAEGDTTQAINCLQEAAQYLDDGGQCDEGARAHLSLAAVYHADNNAAMARDHFERAFQLVSALPSLHSLVVTGREMPRFLQALRNDSMMGPTATRLLRQVARFERRVPSWRRRLRRRTKSVSLAPPRLTIQGFGTPLATVGDRMLKGLDWREQMARDLFFCLLAHPEGLKKESIGELIWPESPAGKLRLRFKNVIYRLRNAVGDEVVLFENDLYRFNRDLDYEYDVENFESQIAQAQRATEPEERDTLYRAALSLYRGPYLADIESAWVLRDRERLWQMFVHAALRLGESHFAAREYDKVLEMADRIFTHDHTVEEAHRLAMRAYAALGNRTAVARQFEQCRQVLKEQLGVSPSRETKELYARLMH